MNILSILTVNMEIIIIIVAVAETLMFLVVIQKCSVQQKNIHDIFSNIVKGLSDVPDKNSNQSIHDQLLSLITYLERKISLKSSEIAVIKKNVSNQLEKNTITETYGIESTFNMCSALVQIFPLLGILGTILALSQIAVDHGGSMKASEVTTAFVLAIDTTILGMFFAIVFMLWEARALARVHRILEDSKKASNFLISILV